MDLQQFNNYLGQVLALTEENELSSAAYEKLMELIDENLQTVSENSSEAEFFKGEKQFYQNNYEDALKHYVEAKKIPLCLFFCYRASSFMSKEKGQNELALTFAKKAIPLYPEDAVLQRLLKDLSLLEPSPLPHDEEKENFAMNDEMEASSYSNFLENSIDEELFSQKLPHRHEAAYADAQSRDTQAVAYLEKEERRENHKSAISAFANVFSPSMMRDQTYDTLTERLYVKNQTEPVNFNQTDKTCTLTEEESSIDTGHQNFAETTPSDLEKRISLHQATQESMAKAYLRYAETRPELLDCCFYTLNGWNIDLFASQNETPPLFTEEERKSKGGQYLRWNKEGVALNPGPDFVKNLHHQGLTVRDIDYVIVTRASQDAHADVKTIYELNNQLNKSGKETHIIHYYLHHKTYRDLSSILKPTSKLARHTIHNLEMFADSPEVEKIELSDSMTLHYFLASPQETFFQHYASQHQVALNASSLGVRFELKWQEADANAHSLPLQVGYISGMKWTPLLAHYLGRVDLLLAGFGDTSRSDYSKTGYNDTSLGYHGTYSLFEEVAPRLMLLTEFGGRDGDIRLEATKQLRQESLQSPHLANSQTVALPADLGFVVDLKSLNVKCSFSDAFVALSDVHVLAANKNFGRLKYLAPQYCI